MFTIFIPRLRFLSSSSIKTVQTTPRSGLTLSTGDFLWHSVRSTNQSLPQRVSENMTHHILHQECSEISIGGIINQIYMRYSLIILKLSFQEARILHQPDFLGATQTFHLLRSRSSSQLRSTFGQTGSTQPAELFWRNDCQGAATSILGATTTPVVSLTPPPNLQTQVQSAQIAFI